MQDEEKDLHLMNSLYKGCVSGYRNFMFEDEVITRLAIKCSKHLFFRRTDKKLPYDKLFRYTARLAD